MDDKEPGQPEQPFEGQLGDILQPGNGEACSDWVVLMPVAQAQEHERFACEHGMGGTLGLVNAGITMVVWASDILRSGRVVAVIDEQGQSYAPLDLPALMSTAGRSPSAARTLADIQSQLDQLQVRIQTICSNEKRLLLQETMRSLCAQVLALDWEAADLLQRAQASQAQTVRAGAKGGALPPMVEWHLKLPQTRARRLEEFAGEHGLDGPTGLVNAGIAMVNWGVASLKGGCAIGAVHEQRRKYAVLEFEPVTEAGRRVPSAASLLQRTRAQFKHLEVLAAAIPRNHVRNSALQRLQASLAMVGELESLGADDWSDTCKGS